MPRRRLPTRISDSGVRLVAGRMVFAAAAEALGGVYGTTVMERALAFSPGARAERHAIWSGEARPRTKRWQPPRTCNKWLQGHVVNDQTLSLIARSHPKVAGRMQQARDGDLVKVLTVAEDDYRFVGSRIASLSLELFGEYLGCMALGHSNPHYISGLSAGLLHLATTETGPEVLVAILGSDRQMPFSRGPAATKSLDAAFDLALSQAAMTQAEISFSKAALADVWSQRKVAREEVEGQQAVSRLSVTELSKLPKFATNLVPNYLFCIIFYR